MLLLIIHLLLGTDCRVEEPDYANADRFYVALAKSQEFFTYDRCGKAQPQVDVYAAPAKAEKIGEIRWATVGADSARRRHGWVLLSKPDEVVPYDELVLGRMAELTDDWDGRISTQPGGRSRELAGVTRPPVSVEDSRRVGGKLWFRVRVLAESPCEVHEPRELARGWVRGYSSRRQPTVRHFSRGC